MCHVALKDERRLHDQSDPENNNSTQYSLEQGESLSDIGITYEF